MLMPMEDAENLIKDITGKTVDLKDNCNVFEEVFEMISVLNDRIKVLEDKPKLLGKGHCF